MSLSKMKSEVRDLKQRLSPDPTVIRLLVHFHGEGTPHGFMGSQWLVIEKGKETTLEAATTEEELKFFRLEEYEKIDPNHSFSYEKWIEIHQCKCGHHGEDGKQPFFGVSTLLKEYDSLSPEEKIAQTNDTLEAYKNRELATDKRETK